MKRLLLCLILLSGCSVYMAAAGKREPNLGSFSVGSSRAQVEQQLGSPVSSVTSPDGKRQDVYEYVIGNEPSAGRAVAHGAADVLTFGLWEVVGTPIEAGSQGEKKRITVVYSSDNKVTAIE